MRWSPDGRALWLSREDEIGLHVERLDMATGRRSPLTDIPVARHPGLLGVGEPNLSDDASAYAYIATEYVSHVFVVEGIR